MKTKYFAPILLLFALTTAFFIIGKNWLATNGFNSDVLLYGNLLLFAATFFSLVLLIKAMLAKTTANFLQAVYGSLMGKLFVCAIGAFIYFKTTEAVNKPAIFILLGFYLVYTFVEIRSVNQLTKDIKNAKTTGSN